MNNLISFILNGANEWTPETVIRIIVFVIIMNVITDIIDNITSIGGRR